MQDITQQQIKKNNIVNRYLNLKSLPDNINYQSLVSMSYYENYKGQNPNSPGKNILNIGEQHYTADEGFYDLINFLNNLIKKNSHLNTCLDFVFEHAYTDQYKYFQNKNLTELGSVQNSSMPTMHGLRRLFDKKRRLKGFRVHETDTRLGFEGFYSSIIYLLRYLEEIDERFVKRKKFISTVAAFIYNIDNEKYINKEKIQSEFWKMFALIEKEGILKKKPSKFKKLSQDTNLSQQDRKYYKLHSNSDSRDVMEFFESVLEYMIYAWGYNDKTDLQYYIYYDELDSNDYLKLSPERYYDYLNKMDKRKQLSTIGRYILQYKSMDEKFAKQLDNIDPDYFLDNAKDLIFVYLIFENGYSLSTVVFYDIQTISRIFRKFDDSKGRFKSCDEENKSLRNIIIYSGNYHTKNINEFLSNLPTLRLLSEPISDIIGKIYFEKMDTKQVSPKLSFGHFRLLHLPKLQFPTNFDYFGYNGKIIDKLKQETNVQNYLQIEKKLIQKQEERKIKQQQQQKKRKEERRRKIEEETKKRWDQYNKIVQRKRKQMQ